MCSERYYFHDSVALHMCCCLSGRCHVPAVVTVTARACVAVVVSSESVQ